MLRLFPIPLGNKLFHLRELGLRRQHHRIGTHRRGRPEQRRAQPVEGITGMRLVDGGTEPAEQQGYRGRRADCCGQHP